MTYSIYIKKDYKMIVHRTSGKCQRIGRWCCGAIALTVCIALIMQYLPVTSTPDPVEIITNNSSTSVPNNNGDLTIARTPDYSTTLFEEVYQSSVTTKDANNSSIENIFEEIIKVEEIPPAPTWETVIVKKGDNLSLIFDLLHLSPQILFKVISLSDKANVLKHLKPGQELHFQISEGKLNELKYDINLTDTLYITRTDNIYSAEIKITKLETRVNEASGIIENSLFLTAQTAGLSDNLTMQLIELYGWDIDFALDIRKGDRFYVYYEERYKNGEKIQDGPILAAEFINQDQVFRALRYTHADGHSDYYSDTGHSMRKAFLRTPVNFTRISSRFNLRRKHPVLNKIHAHRGVDYAAPTGTVIKSTGDGVVTLIGNKGGYGKVVILRHGEKYTTVYGHMSRFSRGIKKGVRVKQGQTIGYVGMTGLATGPHLHYEFRVNGVHRNPLTVKLPKALRIPESEIPDFISQTTPILAQLDSYKMNTLAKINDTQDKTDVMVVLQEDAITEVKSN